MSEEEIINVLKNHAQYTEARVINANTRKEYKVNEAIKGILDLYNTEKEKNKELEMQLEIEKIDNKYNQEERDEETIPRYKIIKKIQEKIKYTEHYIDCVDNDEGQAMYKILNELLEELLEERN